jgi:hypothetical protein
MPTANADVQPTASIDGATLVEPMPSGFIPVRAASNTTALGVALEEMDEGQLTTQVCFRLVGWRGIWLVEFRNPRPPHL